LVLYKYLLMTRNIGTMFESITESLQNVFRSITGKSKLTEENIQTAMREVRVALLEADVNMNVARAFTDRVREEALGEKVISSVEPGQLFTKIIHDNLVRLLKGDSEPIILDTKVRNVIILCGLQGSGKTTTAGKLALKFKNEMKRPLLVAADVQRPAAIEQLKTLGQSIDVPVYAQTGGDPVQICKQALEVARLQNCGVVILDTAGRLHVDDALMNELTRIQQVTNPVETLFVCDAMIGQSAADTAAEFAKRLKLTGAIMTKMDGDARGGAALSLREISGIGIKYITVGEKLDALEEFHPERMAGRILGMGDVVSLVERAQQVVDEKDAQAMQKKLLENQFSLHDFMQQLAMIRKMGNIKDLLGMIPGVGQAIKGVNINEEEFARIEAMIQSMTPEERDHPEILITHTDRRRRIAKGSGTTEKGVLDLLKNFGEMRKMMSKMTKFGMLKSMMTGGGLDMLGNMFTGNPKNNPMLQSRKSGTKPPQLSRKEKKKKRNKNKRR